MARKTQTTPRPAPLRDLQHRLARPCTSIGDYEQLAGVNTESEEERRALWSEFRHLYTAPTQVLFDAVCGHCAAVALERVERGELCLIERTTH